VRKTPETGFLLGKQSTFPVKIDTTIWKTLFFGKDIEGGHFRFKMAVHIMHTAENMRLFIEIFFRVLHLSRYLKKTDRHSIRFFDFDFKQNCN
jgi:hypothetical protein